MNRTRLETVPLTWDEFRDRPFFRMAPRIFGQPFASAAELLLSFNDDKQPQYPQIASPFDEPEGGDGP
jgi:hypothetical protein